MVDRVGDERVRFWGWGCDWSGGAAVFRRAGLQPIRLRLVYRAASDLSFRYTLSCNLYDDPACKEIFAGRHKQCEGP